MTAPAEPHVMKTYGRLPIALTHGRGCRVWDTDGREYLDALGGIAVNTLGHAHPRLVPALQEQVAKLIHTSNYYHVPLQEQLAELQATVAQRAETLTGISVDEQQAWADLAQSVQATADQVGFLAGLLG